MSWEQVLSIYREAADELAAEQAAPPQACPHDGEPLRAAPDGGLYCPFGGDSPSGDHYQWPRDGKF